MQSMRRSRSVLAEMMIAVLFLAVAACILAQMYAVAWRTGEESRRSQAALLLARDALERFTAGEDLPQEWEQAVDGQNYLLEADVTAEQTAGGVFRTCEVTVSAGGAEYVRMETAGYTMEDIPYEDE